MSERFPYAARAARHRHRDYYATLAMAYRDWSPEMIRKAAKGGRKRRRADV